MTKKKKVEKTRDELHQEWRKETIGNPQFVVVYARIPSYGSGYGHMPVTMFMDEKSKKNYVEPNPYQQECAVFETAEEAVRFALQHKDARVFGTMPEYELHYHLKAKV